MINREELLRDRPEPSREFADRLRERLRALDASARRTPHLWTLVATYELAGGALLLIAIFAVGV